MTQSVPHSPLLVRPARFEDWPTLVDFNQRLAWETEQKRLDPAKIVPGVQAVLHDAGKGRYFVAERNGAIVGQMMHTLEWSDWRNGPIWWLQSVYVAPEERQRGVFRELLEFVVEQARSTGVVGIRLYVEDQNQRAQQTYARSGFAPGGYHVLERWLGPSL